MIHLRPCHKCHRPLGDRVVFEECTEPLYPGSSKTSVVAKPLCRRCYTFYDMQRAPEKLVCAGCGFVANVPTWLVPQAIRW